MNSRKRGFSTSPDTIMRNREAAVVAPKQLKGLPPRLGIQEAIRGNDDEPQTMWTLSRRIDMSGNLHFLGGVS